jgi:hypothetical protein
MSLRSLLHLRCTRLPSWLIFLLATLLPAAPVIAAISLDTNSLQPAAWREDLWATWNRMHGDAYSLDAIGRSLEEGQRPDCRAQNLVRYVGTSLRYSGAVYVRPEFRERLARFEQVVADVAREVYGRAPTQIRHAGAFCCRSTRNHDSRLSEHALGNAIDVLGFDFASASRRTASPDSLPKALRHAFQVRVARHWEPAAPVDASRLHRAFLHTLAGRLAERDDIFRVMLGPSHRDHADHFHFDMAPWRYVSF